MAAQIKTLIDKVDTLELVRDKIGLILLEESAAQQALAIEAGKPEEDWKLRVFIERTAPWSVFETPPRTDHQHTLDVQNPLDLSPIVNVSFENDSFDEKASDVVLTQTALGVFNIDCVAAGVASDAEVGHEPADVAAGIARDRAMRLCRNILMSSHYVNLGLLKIVADRFPISRQTFEIDSQSRTVQCVRMMRLQLRVRFHETSELSQYVAEQLEILTAQVKRENGQLLLSARFDYPPSP